MLSLRRSLKLGAESSLKIFRPSVAGIHVEARIEELGLKIPDRPPPPKGAYLPYIRTGNYLFFAGHLPIQHDGKLLQGRLGENYSVEEGRDAARLTALNILASLRHAVGDLDKVKKVIKLTGFVNSDSKFTQQPLVMNGCSEFLLKIFGEEVGPHARSAVGVNVLPLGVPVEIEAIIEVHPDA